MYAERPLYHTLTSKIPCTILDQFSYPLISLPNKRSLDTTSSAKTGFASSVFPSCQTELNAFAAFISCSHQQGTVSRAQSARHSQQGTARCSHQQGTVSKARSAGHSQQGSKAQPGAVISKAQSARRGQQGTVSKAQSARHSQQGTVSKAQPGAVISKAQSARHGQQGTVSTLVISCTPVHASANATYTEVKSRIC